VASVLAMIGAIVAEYFGGSFGALGVLIKSDASSFDFTDAWAGIVIGSVLGIVLYLVVALAERWLVRWAPEVRRT
jgi:NitT/TauT family transport system permease protein